MTSPAADAARAAAKILAADLGPALPAQVEAALHAALHASEDEQQRPSRYDPTAIAGLGIGAASLIVTVAQLAWSILAGRRDHAAEPSHDAITREVRITLREQDAPLPPGSDRITEVVVTEVIRLAGRSE